MSSKAKVQKYLGYYVIWSFFHLIFLTIGWNGNHHEYFWPFGGSYSSGDLEDAYDISEFIAFVFGPIIFLFGLYHIVIGGTIDKINEEIKEKNQ